MLSIRSTTPLGEAGFRIKQSSSTGKNKIQAFPENQRGMDGSSIMRRAGHHS